LLNFLFLSLTSTYSLLVWMVIVAPDHTQTQTRTYTLGRAPLDKWSARRRELYLTTYVTHSRQTSMPPAGFEPTIPAGKQPQTDALDWASTGIG